MKYMLRLIILMIGYTLIHADHTSCNTFYELDRIGITYSHIIRFVQIAELNLDPKLYNCIRVKIKSQFQPGECVLPHYCGEIKIIDARDKSGDHICYGVGIMDKSNPHYYLAFNITTRDGFFVKGCSAIAYDSLIMVVGANGKQYLWPRNYLNWAMRIDYDNKHVMPYYYAKERGFCIPLINTPTPTNVRKEEVQDVLNTYPFNICHQLGPIPIVLQPVPPVFYNNCITTTPICPPNVTCNKIYEEIPCRPVLIQPIPDGWIHSAMEILLTYVERAIRTVLEIVWDIITQTISYINERYVLIEYFATTTLIYLTTYKFGWAITVSTILFLVLGYTR